MIALNEREWRDVRGGEIAMVFQEPMTSLNPVMRIAAQIEQAIRAHESGLAAGDVKRRAAAALGLSYIFISHSLPVVAQVATRIAVICTGKFVELGSAQQILHQPAHEYTRELLAAVPALPG